MPSIKRLSNAFKTTNTSKKSINWYPGHMYGGLKAIIGKLSTVDCVVEVHDARIPLIGRNQEFRKLLGDIKPRLLILNKSDLADLSRWDGLKRRLAQLGDTNVILTDLSGSEFSHATRGYVKLLDSVVKLINNSDRHNRQDIDRFKLMVIGIPNVGKSTLINRLRQHHVGFRGEPAKVGPEAGVTRSVQNVIKICSRPPIYSLDTPGILQPGATKNKTHAMYLALCSTMNDKVVDKLEMAQFLLDYLNENDNYSYVDTLNLSGPIVRLEDSGKSVEEFARILIKEFRQGLYGKVMFL